MIRIAHALLAERAALTPSQIITLLVSGWHRSAGPPLAQRVQNLVERVVVIGSLRGLGCLDMRWL